MTDQEHFYKGFYEASADMIMEKLSEIQSKDPAEVLSYGETIYYHADTFVKPSCAVFAYALHRRFKYDIIEMDDENGSLVHWCCTLNYNGREAFVDIRGITTDYKLFLSPFKQVVESKTSKIKIENLEDYNDEWDEDILKFANEIIDKYYDNYVL